MTQARSLVALHCAVLLFGFAGLFGKWLALSPTAIVFGRTLVAAVVLAAIAMIRRHPPDRLAWPLVGNGLLLAVHWVTFFAAIKLGSVAIGLLGFASFPLFVLLQERVLLGRRWRGPEAITAAMVTLGLVLLVPAFTLGNSAVQGLLWGIASGFTFGLLAVRNRALTRTFSAPSIALWQNAAAAAILLPFAWWPGATEPWTMSAIALVLVLGCLCTAVAHTLFIASLVRLSAHTASVVAALEPVYGMAFAAWLLAEIPDARTCFGALLIVGAAVVASRGARSMPVPE